MKKINSLIFFVILCVPFSGYGQKAIFSGCVINDLDKPEGGIVFLINQREGVSHADTGKFTIEPGVTPGYGVTISLKNKPKFAILKPFMGQTQVPNSETNSGCEPIIIVPRNSPRFLESEALSALIGALLGAANNVELETKTKSEIEAARTLEKAQVITDYANWSGFEEKVIRSALSAREKLTGIKENRNAAEDAYLQGDLNTSGHFFRESGMDDSELEQADNNSLAVRRKKVTDLIKSGNTYFEKYNFKDALISYEILDKFFKAGKFSQETFKYEWLELKYSIGRTKARMSSEAKLDDAITLLNDAVANYEQGLRSITENEFLEKRVMLQYGLGAALLELGENRLNLKNDVSSINSAIKIFNEAVTTLEGLKRNGKPALDLRNIQISIGNAWGVLGGKTRGRESINYLRKSLEAYDKTDKTATDNEGKIIWANLNHNKGLTYSTLAVRVDDPKTKVDYFKKAADGFEEAEKTSRKLLETAAFSCVSCVAGSLINVGNASDQLEQIVTESAERVKYSKKALTAFDQADKTINTIKREEEPFSWADLKARLGQSYFSLAGRTTDPSKNADYLNKAAKVFEEAYVLADYCQYCAISSLIQLGRIQGELGQKVKNATGGVDNLSKALESFEKADKAIESRKLEGRPLVWATLKYDLGNAFSNLAGGAGDPKTKTDYLNKATKAYREAHALVIQDNCSSCAVLSLIDLGYAWSILEQTVDDTVKSAEYHVNMLDALDKADRTIEGIKRAEEPVIWSRLKMILGETFFDLADRTSDPANNADYLHKGAKALEEASSVYNSVNVKEDYCYSCAVHLTIKLGLIWNALEQVVNDPIKRAEHRGKMVEALNKADKVLDSIKNNEDQSIWVSMKTDLGRLYYDIAERTRDPKTRTDFLNKTETAYKEVAAVYSAMLANQSYCSPCTIHSLIDLGNAWNMLERTVGDPAKSVEYRNNMLDALDKANKAIDLIKREEESAKGGLKTRIGSTFSDLAGKTNDPEKNADYVNRAAKAFDEEAKIYAALIANQDFCAPCAISSVINTGLAWTILGERTADSIRSIEFFNKALAVFDTTDKAVKDKDSKVNLANLNLNLGRTYNDIADRTSDPKTRTDFLSKTETAYKEVAAVYSTMLSNQSYCSPCTIHSLIDLGNAWNTLEQTVDDPVKSAEYRINMLDALDKANNAIDLIKREEESAKGGLKARIGSTFSDLAWNTNDPVKNADYVSRAAKAFDEETKIYAAQMTNHDYCSPCAISSVINVGLSWTILGERTMDLTRSMEFFNKALAVFNNTEKAAREKEYRLLMANLNLHLGRTYNDIADRTSDPKTKTDFLKKAVKPLEDARADYNLQANQNEWAGATANLAKIHLLLTNWQTSLGLSNEVLQYFPDDDRAVYTQLGALHDGLYRFDEAYDLNKSWLDRHPDDLVSQSDFAEKNFTTGRFTECITIIDTLLPLPNSKISVDVKTALRAIQIGCMLATDQHRSVAAKLDEMINEVDMQPSYFKSGWIFRGTRYFVTQNKPLAAHQERLRELLDAIEGTEKDRMLRALKELRAKYDD